MNLSHACEVVGVFRTRPRGARVFQLPGTWESFTYSGTRERAKAGCGYLCGALCQEYPIARLQLTTVTAVGASWAGLPSLVMPGVSRTFRAGLVAE